MYQRSSPDIEQQGQVRDKGRCVYCGCNVYRSLSAFCGFTNDHLVPEAKFKDLENTDLMPEWLEGIGSLANHATACTGCNLFAGKWTPGIEIKHMSRDELIAAKYRKIQERQLARYGETYRLRLALIEEQA